MFIRVGTRPRSFYHRVSPAFLSRLYMSVGCWSLTLALLAGVRAGCGSTADLEQQLYDQMTQRTLDAVALFVYQKAFFLARCHSL